MNKRGLIGILIILVMISAFIAGAYLAFKFANKITSAAIKAGEIAGELEEFANSTPDIREEKETIIDITNITQENSSKEFLNISNSSE